MKKLMKFKDEKKENPLLQRIDLFEKSFDDFSVMSFNETSLSSILRDVDMNKGSFYFKFYDKRDLYLSMIEIIGIDKTKYLSNQIKVQVKSENFFDQLRQIVVSTLEYSQKEPRYNSFWRIFQFENDDLKKIVKSAFPELNQDFLGNLVDKAILNGQLSKEYDRNFVYSIVNLYITNMDSFIDIDMSKKEILEQVDKVIEILKKSIGIKLINQ
ncbi:TetR/AcrR family transcriptional regulator [Anaerosphaera multitolerans]|uniref:TetR/AcrR family transcriptional regulator n=1 Tax=Anaerosphaera multitolerans TaxID=2487351 RepID=A0A437S8M9_9FIRM|nr:TetR/AcrR family transcriptional regulator [Anaerosphaera multitolerans]RVU55443.1 TetR/AcrR family transcriptional regulator [Anaerosphaera multitolerans]